MIKLPLIKTQYIVIIFSHSAFSYLHHPTSENIPLSSCYSTPCDFPPDALFLSSLLYVSSWPLVTSFSSSFLTTFLPLHSIRQCSSKELNCTRQDVWWCKDSIICDHGTWKCARYQELLHIINFRIHYIINNYRKGEPTVFLKK